MRQPLCAEIDGFSLHAAVRVEAHDRKRLEQLCRYITRPSLSDEREQLNAAGQVELRLKTPWRDGTTHLVISPLECGHIEPGNRACNDVFACLRCAHQADADVNAASNIRDGAKGLWGDADSTALLLA